MKKDIYNFTMSCTLKTEYKEEATLQIFYQLLVLICIMEFLNQIIFLMMKILNILIFKNIENH